MAHYAATSRGPEPETGNRSFFDPFDNLADLARMFLMEWKLADAKNRLSEVVNLTLTEGPQTITRRGEAVVLISREEYRRLRGETPDFLEFLVSGASLEDVDLERQNDQPREVSL
jgi:antitoxin Phd